MQLIHPRGAGRRWSVSALWLCAVLSLPSWAFASGIEETETGVIGAGRAASRVRVNDFMATWQNPANLAVVPGGNLGFELRLPHQSACFDRARDNAQKYQDQPADATVLAFESFAKVCNQGFPMPTGQVGWAQSFDEGWGYGIGFFTPAAVPTFKYGDDTILTVFPSKDEQAAITDQGIESPNRFLLLERRAIAGWLTAGAGFQPFTALRLGLSAGLGFANIYNRSVASVQGGTFVDQEVLLDLDATDWFIPRLAVSAVVEPVSGFEAMLSLTYQDDIEATGDLELDANGFQGTPLTDCRGVDTSSGMPRAIPGTRCRVTDAQLRVPLPTLEAVLGLRYAMRRTPRTRVLDPMKDEVFDLELNAYWSQTSHVDRYTVQVYEEQPGSPGAPAIAFSTAPNAIGLAAPPQAVIPRRWKDTFGIRFGGDYNLVPSTLSLRAGVSYESRATPVETMNIDVFPVDKLGLHLGLTAAMDNLLFHAGYAHLFYQKVVVPVGRGDVREIVSQNPLDVLPVNEGTYEAALDVFSIGGSARF